MKKLAFVAGVFLLGAGMALAQNPVADQNTQPPQNHKNQGQPINGKTNANQGPAYPVTTTDSVGQTTPGADTEAGVAQQPGQNVDIRHTAPAKGKAQNSKTIQPPNPNDPGQTAQEADVNAQAASRAEIQPGTTLGVNGETNSARNLGEAKDAGASNLPQTNATSQSAATRPASAKNTKKTSANSTSKKSANKKTGANGQSNANSSSQPQ